MARRQDTLPDPIDGAVADPGRRQENLTRIADRPGATAATAAEREARHG